MNSPKTVRSVDPYTLSNDYQGFSVYGFVLYATQKQRDAVQEVRAAVKVRRSMLPAHVTVKGPVCDIPSIAAVQALLDEITSVTKPVPVLFRDPPFVKVTPNGEVIGMQAVEVTSELLDVHVRLIEALNPISATAYFGEKDGQFIPHLTVYHEPEPGLEQIGEKAIQGLEIGTGFVADRISFTGHIGRPFRGEWRLISEHRFN